MISLFLSVDVVLTQFPVGIKVFLIDSCFGHLFNSVTQRNLLWPFWEEERPPQWHWTQLRWVRGYRHSCPNSSKETKQPPNTKKKMKVWMIATMKQELFGTSGCTCCLPLTGPGESSVVVLQQQREASSHRRASDTQQDTPTPQLPNNCVRSPLRNYKRAASAQVRSLDSMLTWWGWCAGEEQQLPGGGGAETPVGSQGRGLPLS